MTDIAERTAAPDATNIEGGDDHNQMTGEETGGDESGNRSHSQNTVADEIARSFEADGLELGDRIPVCFQRPGVPFDYRLMTAADAPNFVASLGSDCHVWANANPLRDGNLGPGNRGGVDDIVALRSMPADLDFKRLRADAESDEVALERAEQIIDGISDALGVAPSKVTRTGGGLQPRWGLDPEDEDARFGPGSPQAERAKIAYKRFGNLASIVAREVWPDAKVDNVFDIAHIFRVPGTFNVKAEYGTPRRVTAYYPGGAALSLDELEDRLDARGVPQEELATAPRPQETYNGPAHADMPATVRRRVDLYVDTVFERIASGMAAAADLGEGQPDSQGRTWQRVIADAGFDGGAMATPWTGMTEGDVLRRLAGLVPEKMRGAVFSGRTVFQTLNNHVSRKAKAAPPEWLAGALADAAAKHLEATSSTAVAKTGTVVHGRSADADLADEELEERHSGQMRMAYRLARAYGDDLMCVRGLGWHHWTGTHFAADEDGHAERAVHEVLGRALAESLGDKQLRADVAKCESANGVGGVLGLAATFKQFAATAKDVDQDPHLLNFTNGTLDLRTMELRPHDPADKITKIAAGAYDPTADRTVWDAFLEQIQPDADERAYLQRVVGQALPGLVTQHLFPVLTGVGGNGKGTLYGLIEKALGDYATVIDPALLMSDEKTGGPEMLQLMGARLVFASETGKGRPLDEALMKRLTGGDKLSARNLYKPPITWEPTHQLVYVTNDLPKVRGNDPAVWRRVRVIPFDVVIPDEMKDDGLGQALEAHIEAVLAWAVEGYIDYREGGMREPATVKRATADYQMESDDVARFVEEECVFVAGGPPGSTTGELHSRWTVWATNSGAGHLPINTFSKELKRLGHATKRTEKGAAWVGLNLTVQLT